VKSVRAVISVSDKTGILEFARSLREMGWEIISTGGTAGHLRQGGVDATEVTQITGFPEILGGRVKTLHPKIHGGILARRDVEGDLRELSGNEISPVDMVVVNLYPFRETAMREGSSTGDILEEIDIGGPTLLRAAAKNWRWVIVVSSPARYVEIIQKLKSEGGLDESFRRSLAVEAFNHTACYDAAIAAYLGGLWGDWPLSFPGEISLGYKKVLDLRYGENPHQRACYYELLIPGIPGRTSSRSGKGLHSEGDGFFSLAGSQIQGKELSFNNINDLDAALSTVSEIDPPACCIVKHAAPCGVALGKDAEEAFRRALEGDPVSSFGGVVAFNCEVDRACALAMKKVFLEVVLAPGFTQEALEILGAKKDLRVLKMPNLSRPCFTVRSAAGGILIQERDAVFPEDEDWKVVSKRTPSQEELRDLRFAMAVCKHVKSNAIVLAKEGATVGIGGGQPNRVDSVGIAVRRANGKAKGSVMASDAFFPFPDSVEEAAKAGITAIAHPGGSIRDAESLTKADEFGMAMVITGKRHFLH